MYLIPHSDTPNNQLLVEAQFSEPTWSQHRTVYSPRGIYLYVKQIKIESQANGEQSTTFDPTAKLSFKYLLSLKTDNCTETVDSINDFLEHCNLDRMLELYQHGDYGGMVYFIENELKAAGVIG